MSLTWSRDLCGMLAEGRERIEVEDVKVVYLHEERRPPG